MASKEDSVDSYDFHCGVSVISRRSQERMTKAIETENRRAKTSMVPLYFDLRVWEGEMVGVREEQIMSKPRSWTWEQ